MSPRITDCEGDPSAIGRLVMITSLELNHQLTTVKHDTHDVEHARCVMHETWIERGEMRPL